ncbi:TonB-dependent receptor plug domain-containing protein [Pseudemcibacter aquimaris]|uniref:TonB-dependent receptor plug domain-containing protein n=1 Tax=Pseudemcibacter aquimaris TaxID=2857064 RepID=UPI0020124790|nr:TonB-dependent receptor [Pseudemcibacter aquimaris]MCC3862074.1 outer membrane beta-barrel protein [Pseudemcibacter aquimaris]WDU58826.1 outer membrane beta-barrel protein [Pseudemcibacter aquimaris]
MSTTALAQELTTDDNSSTVTYKEDYFVQYNPVTLQDMLRSVPGTAALLAQADEEQGGRRVRGFGSNGDQILIDGKRIAGKTNSLGLQLKRIQADSVSYIELIRGTKAGLDVQSEGLIINVVMKESASKSNTVWIGGGEYVDGASVNPLLKITHTGEVDRLKYSLAIDSAIKQTRRNFNDTFFFADGTQYQDNMLTNNMDQKKALVNGGIEYNGENGDILRLNGQLEFDTQDTIELDNQSHLAENTFSVFGDSRTLTAGDDYQVSRTTYHRPFHWEFGGDYERRFDNVGLLKALFVINHGKHDFTRIFESGLNGAEISEDVTNFSTRTHGEKILRASLTQTFAEVHTIEYGGEVAINDVGTSTETTRFDGVVLPGTNDTDTQEKRAEAFISHNYAIASNISLQSSLNAEFSKITQTDNINDVPDNSRNFSFLKPRMNLRYDINEQNQIRVTAERKISQLDFGAFGSNFDAEDGETDGGNGELVPEDRLEFSVAYENRFADDQGSIAIRGFYNKIRDHIARIGVYSGDLPAPDNINQVVTLSVPGNIGDAEEYGVEINGSWRLKAMDLPNAIISGKYILRETEAMDPFLEMERPIQYVQKHEWLVSFQHDLPSTGTSYGFSVTNKGPVGPGGGSVGFRTDVIELWEKTIEPKASFYVEQLVFGNMKLRFDAKNILKAKTGYDLTKYTGNISLGNVNYNEIREASQQRVFSLTLQGSF